MYASGPPTGHRDELAELVDLVGDGVAVGVDLGDPVPYGIVAVGGDDARRRRIAPVVPSGQIGGRDVGSRIGIQDILSEIAADAQIQ